MNTGIHDAVNLGWKLGLVLNGYARADVLLHSYEAERRPNVEKLIRYDKDISRLMTMQLPENWAGDPKADVNEVLGVVMKEAATFSSGLGIFYPEDDLLSSRGSFVRGGDDELLSVAPGRRAPDASLQKPGTFESMRLHKATPNVGPFHVVIFAGNTETTYLAVRSFIRSLSSSKLCDRPWLQYLIIPMTAGPSVHELLGLDVSFARVLYDKTGEAHEVYSVPSTEGAVFVLRPDGWIGTASKLGDAAGHELETYFSRFMLL